MKRTWDTKRSLEHQKLLEEKYDGDIHNKDYHHELYISNMKLYRHRHKERIQEYNREYQQKYREERKFYYGLLMWNRKHPDNPMTMEQYIDYRTQKEIRRQEKLAKRIAKQEN